MSGQSPVLADRMQRIGMSPTMKGTIAAEKLRREGIDVVDLGAGEPDFPTPAHITEAAAAPAWTWRRWCATSAAASG